MASQISNLKSNSKHELHRHNMVSARFQEPSECLFAHLMFECSEVLTGIKPANLISLVNRKRYCGRNLYQIWQEHNPRITEQLTNIKIQVIRDNANGILLFCYDPDQLESKLSHAGIRALLAREGYDTTKTGMELLTELFRRMQCNSSFPHEIGLFIGYPAKDVAAFMGIVNLPFTCQGPWKIFGNPEQSLDLAESFRCSRIEIGRMLAKCDSPGDCLPVLRMQLQTFIPAN